MSQAFAAMIRGMIEYEGTQLRMYYTSKIAPGVRNMTGVLNTSQLGYSGQQAILYTLLPVLSILTIICGAYLILALQTGLPHTDDFDPLDTTCLIAASASGAKKGMLVIDGAGSCEAENKSLLSTRILYEEGQGLVTVHANQSPGSDP
jgi:hypothetical protein